MKGVIFIDGENLKNRIRDVFKKKEIPDFDFAAYDLKGLFDTILDEHQLNYHRLFYRAKPEKHPDILQHSEKIIEQHRLLGGHLGRQGFKLIKAGVLRADYKNKGDARPQYREKGVDVRLAVDMVSLACDGVIDEAILVASDSDYQPAVAELRKRKVRVVYVGFAVNPNYGLIAKTNDRLIVSDKEVLTHTPTTLFDSAA